MACGASNFFNWSLMYGFNNNNFQCSVLQFRNDNQNVFFYKLDYTSQQRDCLLLKVLFNPNLKSQYKLKRCSNKECCKQCRYVMFKGTMTNWPVKKLTQGTIQNSYNIMTQQTFRQTIFLCFSDFFLFSVLLIIS